MTGDKVTHVVLPVDEYEVLIANEMAHEAIAQMANDDKVEWIDADLFALQLAADRIVHARKARKMTQKQLAEKLGVPQSQISRIERNPDHTTVRTLKRIAKALNVDIRALIS